VSTRLHDFLLLQHLACILVVSDDMLGLQQLYSGVHCSLLGMVQLGFEQHCYIVRASTLVHAML
jgi:hypothetical protein